MKKTGILVRLKNTDYYQCIKNSDKIQCVYIIRNSKNGKMYVGETSNLYMRLKQHESKVRTCKIKGHTLLKNDYNNYGGKFIDLWEYVMVKKIDNLEERKKLERKLIKEIRTTGLLLNSMASDNAGFIFNEPMTEERKQKIRDRMT